MKYTACHFFTALCIFFVWSDTATASLQDGLMASYPFNGNADDATGNGYDGAATNTVPTADRAGIPNAAFNFDGSSSIIEVSKVCPMEGQQTFVVWVRPNDISARSGILEKAVSGYGGEVDFFLEMEAGGDVRWLVNTDNGSTGIFAGAYGTTALLQGRWSCVATVIDQPNNQIRLYVNGVLDAVANMGGRNVRNANRPFRIGKFVGNQSSAAFNGGIDEVRIYNRILSDGEIATLSGPLPPASPQPALPIFTVAGSTPPAILTTARAKGKLVNPLGVPFDPNKAMTIVLTHGWTSSSGAWPADMAAALKYSGYDQIANIIAWDWQDNANPGGTMPTSNPFKYAANLALATSMTSSEGRALGVALIALPGLGSKPVHFMGHSLGTLVNCTAADYLHGDSPGSPSNTAKNPPVQMTLFDEAELAQAIHGIAELADILYKPQGASEPTGSLSAKVLPSHYQWADSYVSLVGLLHPQAANMMAWLEVYHLDSAAHGYAYQWYEGTITTPSAASLSAMGHYWSFENNTLSRSDLPALGSLFKQSTAPGADPNTVTELAASDEALFRLYGVNTLALPSLLAYDGSYAVANTIPSAVANAVQYGGTVSGSIIQAFTPVNGQPVYIGSADSTPGYFSTPASPSPIYQANWDLQLTIGGQSGAANLNRKTSVNTLATRPPAHPLTTADGASPSFVVMPVSIPSTAVGMTFDYEFNTAGPDDFMTMGIQDDNYFLMEAANTQDNTWNTTPVIDVSGYAGQTVQYTFVLNNSSGGSPVGTMQVHGIQFYNPPVPTLKLQIIGGQASVSWPLSAVNWTLELNTDLSNANGWQAVSGTPTDANYFHTINFEIGTSTKAFFRLRK